MDNSIKTTPNLINALVRCLVRIPAHSTLCNRINCMVEHGAMFCDAAIVETLRACLVACLGDTSSGFIGGEAMSDAMEIARALGAIPGAVSEVRTLISHSSDCSKSEYSVKVFISHIEVEKLAHKRVEETECGETDVYLYSDAGIRRNPLNDLMQDLTN